MSGTTVGYKAEPSPYAVYNDSSRNKPNPVLVTYAEPSNPVDTQDWQHQTSNSSGSQAWQQWTSTMTGNLEPQDCFSANALMQMGAGPVSHAEAAPQDHNVAAWPLNIFDIGQGPN